MRYLLVLFLFMHSFFGFSQIENSFLSNENSLLGFDKSISINEFTNHKFGLDPVLLMRLQKITDDYSLKDSMVGLSVAMNFEDDEIWAYANGISADDEVLTPEHSMAVGSITKTIVAATILKLHEEGSLSLEDTIGTWINHPFVDPQITIRQCLNHTSGIYNYTENLALFNQVFLDMSRIWTATEILDLSLNEKIFDKGEKWSYCNSNYLILGLIIEGITGEPFHEVVRSKILDQKGFDNIQLYTYETLNTDLADLWLVLFGSTLNGTNLYNNNLNALFSTAWSAGAYISTPTDISKWAKTLYKGELLEDASMVEMLTETPVQDGGGYGLGTAIYTTNEGVKFYGHNGEIAYSSSMFYIPTLDLSIVACTNDGTPSGDNLSDLILQLVEAYVDFMVGIESVDFNQKFEIFPNPTSNSFTINLENKINDKVDFQIVDMLGNLVKFDVLKVTSKKLSFSILDLKSGMYNVTLFDGKQKMNQRLIITK